MRGRSPQKADCLQMPVEVGARGLFCIGRGGRLGGMTRAARFMIEGIKAECNKRLNKRRRNS